MKSLVSISVIILSLALLIPGVTQPILTIQGSIEKAELVETGVNMFTESLSESSRGNARSMMDMAISMFGFDTIEGEVEVFYKTRSIVDTVDELYQSNNVVVAGLVGLFSVVFPAMKLSLLLVICLPWFSRQQQSVVKVISAIGKWSMADVFVVALIIVYMAGNASAGMGELLKTTAQFETGFYFFSAYCVFSIASQWLVSALFINTSTQPFKGERLKVMSKASKEA
ncbi:paraquat-inducible protein A [Shewanella sp. KT0246]|uniref:paraquat-inducible protein A n=1 Tax=Shewanella sp. KT0246 TaxID=2815912 RepID=UPI001BBE8349|nr:paraquat-inducible protein A [Shewanella sp. KT0246]GIU49632.1 paraquat-inducible membrane protein PqiA family [Shewanella sp. KT0246]